MPFTIVDGTGPVISAKISGELDESEVGRLQAAAAGAIKRHGTVSALFMLENFKGWKQSGNWGDITFMTEHDKDIARIAVVGEEGWRDMIYAFLAKGFRAAQIEYFRPDELAQARAWLSKAS